MQLSDIPAWFAKRFAADATGSHVRNIPTTTADPTAASLELGFPPDTFTAVGSGGTPPDGRDFNGILRQLSAWSQWVGLGGPAPWSASIRDAAGGYPLGSVVQSSSVTGRLYQSRTNNNTTNPDAGGAGWIIMVDQVATPDEMAAGTSNERVVTPALLSNRGYDPVIAQSLIANGGFRIFASGYKECWGLGTFPANSSTTINYPITFTHFSNAVVQAPRQATGAQDNDPAAYQCNLTNFRAWSASDVSTSGYWQAKGR